MKIQLPLIISLCATILFVSCEKEDNTPDNKWKIENEAQFATITATEGYTRINSQSAAGHIMYKVIKSGDPNSESPKFTDRVRVLYTGWYKNYWSIEEDKYTDERGQTIINKKVFDSTENRNNNPSTFFVNPNASSGGISGVIDGFSTALQHMKVGDKWEVWIPWRLGYGEATYASIPGYTTLVFEIELVSIIEN